MNNKQKTSTKQNIPFVSVIIPSFNRINTIGQTIESILAQKCNFTFEIIIGDDKSDDSLRVILKEYQQKYPEIIRLIFHEQNVGLGANWALCVKQCQGKYIANCDDDDYWHYDEKLQLQVDFLENNVEYGVCHSDFRNYYQKSGKFIEEKVSELTYGIPMHITVFKGIFRFCNSTVMYRKELIDKYIKLDDYIQEKFNLQDWMTLLIIGKYAPFHCLPISTTTLRIDNASITRPKTFEVLEARMKVEEACYKYVCNFFPDDLKYDEVEYRKFTYNIFLNHAYLYRDYKLAKRFGEKLKQAGRKGIKIRFSGNKFLFFIYSFWFVWTQNYKFAR